MILHEIHEREFPDKEKKSPVPKYCIVQWGKLDWKY